MRKFVVLLKKEIRELLTLQTLAPLFFTVLRFIFMGKVVGDEGKKVSAQQTLSVLDMDQTSASKEVIGALSKSGLKVQLYKNQSIDSVIDDTKKKKGSVVLVIPANLERDLTSPTPPQIRTYNIVSSFSFVRIGAGVTIQALATINDFLSTKIIKAAIPNVNPQKL